MELWWLFQLCEMLRGCENKVIVTDNMDLKLV